MRILRATSSDCKCINPFENMNQKIMIVNQNSVNCSGEKSVFSHPNVFLKIPEGSNYVECPYCNTRFELSE